MVLGHNPLQRGGPQHREQPTSTEVGPLLPDAITGESPHGLPSRKGTTAEKGTVPPPNRLSNMAPRTNRWVGQDADQMIPPLRHPRHGHPQAATTRTPSRVPSLPGRRRAANGGGCQTPTTGLHRKWSCSAQWSAHAGIPPSGPMRSRATHRVAPETHAPTRKPKGYQAELVNAATTT